MPIRRAFSTLGCPDLTLEGALSLASRHGIEAVELRTLEGTTDLPGLFARMGAGELRRILAGQGGVQVMSLSTSFRLVGPADADREAFLSFVPWAESLGVPWLRVFDGGEAPDPDAARLAAETLRWWRRLKDGKGWKVDVMVETHDSLVAREAIGRFCAESRGVALLWDAHNTWRRTGVHPLDLWPHIAGSVVHIHVKDSVSRASDGLPYTYVPPGDGEFPMGPLRDALMRQGYKGRVSLEWERQWHPGLAPLERALQCAAERGWW